MLLGPLLIHLCFHHQPLVHLSMLMHPLLLALLAVHLPLHPPLQHSLQLFTPLASYLLDYQLHSEQHRLHQSLLQCLLKAIPLLQHRAALLRGPSFWVLLRFYLTSASFWSKICDQPCS